MHSGSGSNQSTLRSFRGVKWNAVECRTLDDDKHCSCYRVLVAAAARGCYDYEFATDCGCAKQTKRWSDARDVSSGIPARWPLAMCVCPLDKGRHDKHTNLYAQCPLAAATVGLGRCSVPRQCQYIRCMSLTFCICPFSVLNLNVILTADGLISTALHAPVAPMFVEPAVKRVDTLDRQNLWKCAYLRFWKQILLRCTEPIFAVYPT